MILAIILHLGNVNFGKTEVHVHAMYSNIKD